MKIHVDGFNPGYIARMKKEQQDRLAHSPSSYTARASSYNDTSSFAPRARGAFSGSYRGGPHRGGYSYGVRGAASYHPYQRPPPAHGSSRFKNRTVVFNKPEISDDAAGTESHSAPGSVPTSTSHSRQNSQPPTEVKQLCATFTSTGTREKSSAPTSSLSRPPLTNRRSLYSPRLPTRARPGQAGTLQALAFQERLQQGGSLLFVPRTHTT